MAKKTTIFETVTTSSGGIGGSILLGGLVITAGLLAIDHHYSPKGTSAIDKWKSRFFPGSHVVGAPSSLASLPPLAEKVVMHALAFEHDAPTLTSLAQNLKAAGYADVAQALLDKAKGKS